MTIKMKLAASFAIVLLLLAGIAGFGIKSLADLNQDIQDLLTGPLDGLHIAKDVNTDQSEVMRALKTALLEKDATAAAAAFATAKTRVTEMESRIRSVVAEAPEGARADWEKILELTVAGQSLAGQIMDAYQRGDLEEAVSLSNGQIQTDGAEIRRRVAAAQEYAEGEVKQAIEQGVAAYEFDRLLLITTMVAGILIGILASVWLSMSVTRGLNQAIRAVRLVAEGDLTEKIEVRRTDEIGKLLGSVNDMIERLRGVVRDALTASANVSGGSANLSAASEQLSQGATEQASSAEEASASMEEIAANIKQNADNAAQTEKIARQSAKDAEQSGDAVNRAVEAMRIIADKISIVQEIALRPTFSL